MAELWSHGLRPLGNDSFGYLELTKQFRLLWPNHLGDWWPFGFPLLGAFVSRLGLSAYASLFAVNASAFALIAATFCWAASRAGLANVPTVAVVAAGLCAPICPVLTSTILSEPTFALLLFILALCLANFPSRVCIIGSVIAALAAFTVRYVGVFAVAIIGVFALLEYKELARSRRRAFFSFAYVLGCAAIALLCYSNYRHHGHVSGPQPVGGESITTLPQHLARFGWSPVSAFSSQTIANTTAAASHNAMFIIGMFVSVALVAFLVTEWKRASDASARLIRPMIAIAIGYCGTVVVLRSIAPFDDLASARTFLPAMFPVLFLILNRLSRTRPRILICTSVGLLITDGVLAVRGMSSEVAPDVRAARLALASVVSPADTVAVNGRARSVAAYFRNRFLPTGESSDRLTPYWDAPERWEANRTTLTLLAFSDRANNADSSMWNQRVSEAVARGRATSVSATDSYLLIRSKE